MPPLRAIAIETRCAFTHARRLRARLRPARRTVIAHERLSAPAVARRCGSWYMAYRREPCAAAVARPLLRVPCTMTGKRQQAEFPRATLDRRVVDDRRIFVDRRQPDGRTLIGAGSLAADLQTAAPRRHCCEHPRLAAARVTQQRPRSRVARPCSVPGVLGGSLALTPDDRWCAMLRLRVARRPRKRAPTRSPPRWTRRLQLWQRSIRTVTDSADTRGKTTQVISLSTESSGWSALFLPVRGRSSRTRRCETPPWGSR
jgi:hypothetical protein